MSKETAKHKWTEEEVLEQAKKKYKGFDPAKLAAFVQKLMTIFSALLPLFMADNPNTPKFGFSAGSHSAEVDSKDLALFAVVMSAPEPTPAHHGPGFAGPRTDAAVHEVLDKIREMAVKSGPEFLAWAQSMIETGIHAATSQLPLP